MIKYRLAMKVEGKNVAIHAGWVSADGKIELPLPASPTEGVIVIEWETLTADQQDD